MYDGIQLFNYYILNYRLLNASILNTWGIKVMKDYKDPYLGRYYFIYI